MNIANTPAESPRYEPWYKYGIAVLLVEMAIAIAESIDALLALNRKPSRRGRVADRILALSCALCGF